MPRSDRKQREFERREEDILDVALTLFSRPNWEAVTIAQIADEAEVAKGTVYNHFASKDELLFRLMLRFYRGLLVQLRDLSRDADDLEAGFREIFEMGLRYHLEHREYRYVVEYCNRIDFKERAEPGWHEAFKELDQAFSEWGDPLILNGMERGIFESRPLQAVTIGMHACFEGAVNMLWAGKDWCEAGTEEEVIEAATAFMMSGLVGQPGKG